MKETNSRRAFLAQSGTLVGATWLSLAFPSVLKAAESTWRDLDDDDSFVVLSAEEAAEIEAFASQIFPSDDTPGAKEIGVVRFIDRSLASFNAGLVDPIRNGLAAIQAKTSELFPGTQVLSSLGSEDQFTVMTAIENEGYFGMLRFLTIVGMFSNPSYGGNKAKMGWNLIGFDDRHVWRPPFGYYDANYSTED